MRTMHFAAVVLLVGSGLACAAAPASHWGSSADPVVRQMTEVEALWSDTNCGPAQAELKAAVAPDFRGTSPSGMRYDRSGALGSGDNKDCHLQQIRVHFFGEAMAVVYGNESYVAANEHGSESKVCLAWTDTWLKRHGQWQIVAAQDNYVRCN